MSLKLTFIFCLCVAFAPISNALPPPSYKQVRTSMVAGLDTYRYVNANSILMFDVNNGAFGYDLGGILGKTDGLYYPYVSVQRILDGLDTKTLIYASGIWVGAIDSTTGDTLVTVAEYSQEFFPGRMIGGTYDPGGLSNPAYKVYKIYSDSLESNPNQDYVNWPVSQGAPLDSTGRPAMIGDQMLWSVFNDANVQEHTNDAGLTAPLGIEVRKSVHAFNRQGALGSTVFMRFKILNKGTKVLKNVHISLWGDPDVGGASDDLVGCDTTMSIGYCYNATNADLAYGSTPPAIGYLILQGPLYYTGSPQDTGFTFGGSVIGYTNQKKTSFAKYINGTDPHSFRESYRYMTGRDRDGAPYPNGTKYSVPGDPVAGTGNIDANPSDRRFMITTGPLSLRPGDSTELIAAVIVGQLSDRLASITRLKYYADTARMFYREVFLSSQQPPSPPAVSVCCAYQWSASDGGNNHWYGLMDVDMYWRHADSAVFTAGMNPPGITRPPYLATVTSSQENSFIRNSLLRSSARVRSQDFLWLGGLFESSRWGWKTGEPFNYQNWSASQPDNAGLENALGLWGEAGAVYPLKPIASWNNSLQDWNYLGATQHWSVLEWGNPFCGDVDNNQKVNVLDLTAFVKYLFGGGTLSKPENADASGDGNVNVVDIVRVAEFLFNSGSPLACAAW